MARDNAVYVTPEPFALRFYGFSQGAFEVLWFDRLTTNGTTVRAGSLSYLPTHPLPNQHKQSTPCPFALSLSKGCPSTGSGRTANG